MASTWRDAEDTCSAVGAHLCTELAISSDVTRGTGCGYDNKRVFTSTKCATTPGGPLDGYIAMRGKYPDYAGGPICLKPDQEVSTVDYKVRCCSLKGRALAPGASFVRFDEPNSGGVTNDTGDAMDYDYGDIQSDYYDDAGSATPPAPGTTDGPSDNNGASIREAAGGGADDDDGKSLSGGVIAVIVIVVLLAVVVAAVIGALVGRRMLRTERAAPAKAVPEIVVDSAVSIDDFPPEKLLDNELKEKRLSAAPSIRTTSYSSAVDEPVGIMEDNGFVLDKDGSLRLHSVRRENPTYRASTYDTGDVVGPAGVNTNTSL